MFRRTEPAGHLDFCKFLVYKSGSSCARTVLVPPTFKSVAKGVLRART